MFHVKHHKQTSKNQSCSDVLVSSYQISYSSLDHILLAYEDYHGAKESILRNRKDFWLHFVKLPSFVCAGSVSRETFGNIVLLCWHRIRFRSEKIPLTDLPDSVKRHAVVADEWVSTQMRICNSYWTDSITTTLQWLFPKIKEHSNVSRGTLR